MKTFSFSNVVAIVTVMIALGAVQFGSSSVVEAQTDRWVDPDAASVAPGTGCGTDAGYTTIQAAIDAAAAGDTINVCAGTYNEGVNVGKPDIILRGAKAGVAAGPDASPAGRGGADESVVNGTGGWAIRLDNARNVVDGFTLNTDPARPADSGVFLTARAPDSTVVNNLISAGAAAPTSFASAVRTASFSGQTISWNNMQGFRYGMNIDGAPTDPQSTVEENYAAGNSVYAAFMNSSVGPGHQFLGNLMEMNNRGMLIFTGQLISGNTIQENDLWGIVLFAFNGGDGGPLTGAMISENDLLNNGDAAIYVFDVDPAAVGNEAHQNNIVGNGAGVVNENPNLFDAECNWWGSDTGPNDPAGNPTGTGDSSTGNVDYVPWLTAPAPGGACDGPIDPTTIDDCMNGGWEDFGFSNQGRCIQFVNTGIDSR